MKYRNVLAVTLAVAAVLATRPVLAGAFEDELGTDDAKIADSVKFSPHMYSHGSESGRGQGPYLRALGAPPKRVALVSFFVWDTGNTKNHIYAGWKTTNNVTANAIDDMANGLYQAGIGSLKDAMKANGIELLTIDEALDTPEKRQAYESFNFEVGAGGKIANFFNKSNKDNTREFGVPQGYRLLALGHNNDVKGHNFDIADTYGKLPTELGHDLASSIGVDAVAVVYIVIQGENKSIDMLGAYLYIFGPNPVKLDPSTSLYWTGHLYSGSKLKLEVPFIATNRKGVELDRDYDGFAHVARALGTHTGQYLVAETTGKN